MYWKAARTLKLYESSQLNDCLVPVPNDLVPNDLVPNDLVPNDLVPNDPFPLSPFPMLLHPSARWSVPPSHLLGLQCKCSLYLHDLSGSFVKIFSDPNQGEWWPGKTSLASCSRRAGRKVGSSSPFRSSIRGGRWGTRYMCVSPG